MQVSFVEGSALEKEWRELVAGSPGSRAQHSLEWKKSVEAAYPPLEAGYVLVEEKGAGVLGLPAFFVKSALFGNRVISLPFVDCGGFVGAPNSSRAAIAFSKLRSRFACDKLEVRLSAQSPQFGRSQKALRDYGFSKKSERQLAVVALSSEQKMWEGFDKHARNDVRKAEKSGLELSEVVDAPGLDSFYEVYFREMKRFGSPQHPKKFFEGLYANLAPKKMFFGWNCCKDGAPAGSLLMFFHNNCASVAYSVSSPELRQYRPNDLLYWTAIKKAIQLGAESLDLGQVQKDAEPGSHAQGILDYKLKWGAKLFDRPYYYFGNGKKPAGAAGGLKHLQKIWRRLPNPVVRKLGPWVCRQLSA